MKSLAALFLAAALWLTPAVANAASPAQQRVALVIGNGTCAASPVKIPLGAEGL